MQLPILQSLSPEKQKLLFIIVGVLSFAGLIALIAGIFFNPSQETQTTTETASKVKPTTTSSSTSDYPTPFPTEDQTLDYFISSIPTTPPLKPTATPLPGNFYTANGKQNDLTINVTRLNDWDSTVQIQLINTKTKEVRAIGKGSNGSPGQSAFFSKNFSTVIFAGGKIDETDTEKISFYTISLNKITKQISLADMKKALPTLQISPIAVLSRLLPSPNGQKIAFSYGPTYSDAKIDPNTVLIVIEMSNNRMTLLPVKGLMKAWKDDTTLEYEPSPGATQEIKVN